LSAVIQTDLEKNLFGNYPVSLAATEPRGPPPAFASDPLVTASSPGGRENNASSLPLVERDQINIIEGYSAATGVGSSKLLVTDIVEIDGPSSAGNFMKTSSPVSVLGFCHQLVHFLFAFDFQNATFFFFILPTCHKVVAKVKVRLIIVENITGNCHM
jgi:hypothetical protein